jgi:putative oxidoreductase
MKKTLNFAQLYLRLALGIGFLIPVADRLGWLGPAGQHNISWGNWGNFVKYTNALLPFLSVNGAYFMAILATIFELTIGLLLIIGYKTRIAAFSGFALTLSFALAMGIFLDIKAPFTYSVFSDSAACLLLAGVTRYSWSFEPERSNTLDKANKLWPEDWNC